jgi:MFS transporter, DHA2 family, multidrug resistance protein
MTSSLSPTSAPGGAAASGAFVGSTLSSAQLRFLLLGLSLATGMEFYTFDSMNLVLADLTGSFGVSPDEASWILTVYSSTLFLGVPVSIWTAGHYGYKRFLIVSVIVFAAASMGCALATSLRTMLFWRAVQGLAGSGLTVWWRASLYILMPKAQRSVTLMRVSTVLFLSSALGLVTSGWITDHYNWRLIFLPDLLYAGGAVWLLARYYPAIPKAISERLTGTDWPGISLLAVALISLQVILSRGEIDDWFGSLHIRALAWLGGAALLLFGWWQTSPRNRTPLLRLDLFRNRYVLSSALIGIFTGMILSGSLFVLPEYLRNVAEQSHSATQAGRLVCVYALTAAALRPWVVDLIAQLGQRKTIAISLGALVASMLLFNRFLTAGTSDGYYVLPLMLYGCCVTILLPSVGSGTVAKIEQTQLLDGVSLYMTFRTFGTSLGIALLTILIEQRETFHSSRLFEHLHAGNPLLDRWLQAAGGSLVFHDGISPGDAGVKAAKALAEAGARQAITLSNADAFGFMAAIGVLALCCIPIIPPTPTAKK